MNEQNKPIALVLGGTIPHIELILQLKDRGYFTVLIDYLADSPAKSVADVHIQESTLDKEKVYQIALNMNAKLIICGCVDQANISACYAMERLGYKPPYSYETAVNITNKGIVKKTMIENNIPTPKYVYLDNCNLDSIDFDLRYPVIVKPADSNSANGVRKAYNFDDLQVYFKDAIRISRNGRAIVEEFITGKEISAYCMVKDKKAKLLMTAERISTLDGSNEIIKCYASIAPARISEKAERNVEVIANQIARAFDLDNTALFFQGIVNGDNIDIIELAPRIGGGVCFKTIKENTGFDPITAIIDSWEGKTINFNLYRKPKRLMVVNTIYGNDSIFDHIDGKEELLQNKDIIGFYQIRSKNDRINNNRASSSRIAFCVISAQNEQDMLKKAKLIYNTIKVIDVNGRNVIRNDLNLNSLWKED